MIMHSLGLLLGELIQFNALNVRKIEVNSLTASNNGGIVLTEPFS